MQGLVDYSSDEDESIHQAPVAATAAPLSQVAPAAAPAAAALPFLSELPDVRTDGVSAETLTRVGQYLEAQSHYNFDLTDSIKRKRDFGNPHILTKVCQFFEIDELGSNYPPSLFDPMTIKRKNEPDTVSPSCAVATASAPPAPIRTGIAFVPATAAAEDPSATAAAAAAAATGGGGGKEDKKRARASRWG